MRAHTESSSVPSPSSFRNPDAPAAADTTWKRSILTATDSRRRGSERCTTSARNLSRSGFVLDHDVQVLDSSSCCPCRAAVGPSSVRPSRAHCWANAGRSSSENTVCVAEKGNPVALTARARTSCGDGLPAFSAWGRVAQAQVPPASASAQTTHAAHAHGTLGSSPPRGRPRSVILTRPVPLYLPSSPEVYHTTGSLSTSLCQPPTSVCGITIL